MRRKWFMVIAALLAIVLIAVAGCAKPAPPAPTGPVKIGFIGPLTGPISADGLLMADNAELAARIANEKGGILGGRQVEILRYDNKCMPEDTVAMARKAIEVDKVKALTGFWETANVEAVRPIGREYKIPVCPGTGGGIDTMEDWYPGWFHHGDLIVMDMKPIMVRMETDPKLETIALVWEDMEFTRDGSDILHRRWDVSGSPIEIVGEIWHPIGQGKLKLEYTKAMGFNPDAIFMSEWSPPAIIGAIMALHEIGYEGVVFTGTPLARGFILQQVGEAAEGIMVGATLIEDPSVPENVAYCARHREEISEDIYFCGMCQFEATEILILGMDKAGTDSDAEKIDEAVRTLDYTFLSGDKMELTPEGRVVRHRTYLAQVQGGKIVMLEYTILELEDYAYYLR